MARSILSLGMDCALALLTARRRRGFIAGSGKPDLAATVISRASLEKILERTASWRPLRCMMFLNCEWPAMTVDPSSRVSSVMKIGRFIRTRPAKIKSFRLSGSVECRQSRRQHPAVAYRKEPGAEPRPRVGLNRHPA